MLPAFGDLDSWGTLDVDVAVLSAHTYCDGLLGRVGSAVAGELVAHMALFEDRSSQAGMPVRTPM